MTLPRVTTETGIKIEGDVTEEVQGLMYLSTYLAQFKRGWSYTAMYILRDRSDETGNQTFGFYKTNYTPRLAANYLHNFTTILADKNSIQSPEQFTYTISPTRPATVHELLLQKNNGTKMLVVWGERFKGGDNAIDVQFENTFDVVNVYDPTVGTEPIQKLINVSSVSLVMTNHPYIIEINPSATEINQVHAVNKILNFYSVENNSLCLNSNNPLKRVELFSLEGKKMWQQSDVSVGITNIDIASLPLGVYILRVVTSDEITESHKIIKL